MTHRSQICINVLVAMVCVLVGIGCRSDSAADTASITEVQREHVVPQSHPLDTFPASFEGELPCTDCQGVFYHLDLFEDRVFFLRTTKIGYAVGAVSDAIGSWDLDRDRSRLALFGDWESPMLLAIVGHETLRKLDAEGREIDTTSDHDLRLKPGIAPIEPRLTMRGMYSSYVDAARFEECLSGRRFTVAMEADNISLERAYLDARREPGEPLMVSLRGRIAERPAMEGNAMLLTVVPEHFLGVWPGETCGPRRSVSPLENNYLKLTWLGDHKVPAYEGRREPHIVLHSEQERLAGTGGCNRFSSTYEIEGSSIRFGPVATTKMACLESKDVDFALLAALEEATGFRKTAHHLELLDAEGATVARFEARELQ